MLWATLVEGLSDYAIGGKIRALRLKKKMGLAGAAARASGWEGDVLSLRVVGLPGERAAVQLVLRRVLAHGARKVRLHTHAGVEFIYTLNGRLKFTSMAVYNMFNTNAAQTLTTTSGGSWLRPDRNHGTAER